MKTLKELTRQERINFLKSIESGEINIKKFSEGAPVFLTDKGDPFLSLMMNAFDRSITLTPEAKQAKTKLQEIINNQ